MENNYYVYIHRKLTDGECFYVGKGTKDRYKNIGGRNQHWHNVVNKHGFESIIIINGVSEKKAFELESIICSQIGYNNLTNIRTENGWGGYTMNDSTKLKLSNLFKGKTLTSTTKEKIGNANRGKKHTEETKTKISNKLKGHQHSDETKNKISQSKTGLKPTQETINKMKKPKPLGFSEMLQNRKVTWGDKISQNRTDKNGKPVSQYDQHGNFIQSFPSAKKAAEYIGVNPVNMIYHLNGKYKTCKNYIFKYII